MKLEHVSYVTVIITIIKTIIAGEKPAIAIRACFSMRRLVNKAYSFGITAEELLEMLKD
jgi:hypothetical protein